MTNADNFIGRDSGATERNRLWLNDRLCIPLWLRTRNGTKTDKENVAGVQNPQFRFSRPPKRMLQADGREAAKRITGSSTRSDKKRMQFFNSKFFFWGLLSIPALPVVWHLAHSHPDRKGSRWRSFCCIRQERPRRGS